MLKRTYAVQETRERDLTTVYDEAEFDSLHEALAAYEGMDIRARFVRECECAGRRRGVPGFGKRLVENVYEWDEDWEDWELVCEGDIIECDTFDADDLAQVEKWDGGGWYAVVFSGRHRACEPARVAWVESEDDLAAMYLSARKARGMEFNAVTVEFLGDGDEPEEN